MGMSLAFGPSLTSLRNGSAWSPAALLAGASQLAWYDPSDLTTLFQDAARTTPVTTDGQEVLGVADKSGNGNHLTGTAGTAPLYKTSGGLHWLQFDGVDNFLVSGANIVPGSVDKMQVFAGVRKPVDTDLGMIVELSAALGSNNGSFNLRNATSGGTNGNAYTFSSRGTASSFAGTAGGSYVAPITNVLSGIGDISGDVANLRVNGTSVITAATDQGTGNYGSYLLYVGRRGGSSLPFNGNIYSLVIRFSSANLGAAVIDQAEAWTAAKCGVTL